MNEATTTDPTPFWRILKGETTYEESMRINGWDEGAIKDSMKRIYEPEERFGLNTFQAGINYPYFIRHLIQIMSAWSRLVSWGKIDPNKYWWQAGKKCYEEGDNPQAGDVAIMDYSPHRWDGEKWGRLI